MIGTLAALAVAAILQDPTQTPSPPAPQAVAPGVWLVPGSVTPPRQPDGNTVVFVGLDGLVVVDTGRHSWHRQAVVDLAGRERRPVSAIVNTHWHLDHISGNAALKIVWPGAPVHASGALDGAIDGFLRPSARQGQAYLDSGQAPSALAEDIRGDLASIAAIGTLAPDVVVREDGLLTAGGRALEVRLAPHAATEGDVWLLDPASGVAVVGDLVTLPAPFMDTACPDGWRTALDAVAAAPFQHLVPGHGPVMDRAAFETYRDAFGAFVDCGRSDRPAADCAVDWTGAVRPLLADDAQAVLSTRMSTYYVDAILRSDQARARFCPAV